MSDHDPELQRLEDAVRDRLRGGTAGIHARADAMGVLSREVGVRKRQRRAAGAVAVLATVAAVAVPTALLTAGRDDRPEGPGFAQTDTPTTSPTETAERPAAFFVSLVGGGSKAKVIDFSNPAGVKKIARFLWFDDNEKSSPPVQAGIGLERTALTPAEGCQQLVAASGGECSDVGDGWQAHVLDTTAAEARLAPLHDYSSLTGTAPDDPVRSVTVVRDDGWAVTVLLCACTTSGPDRAEPPLSADVLVGAVADPRWVVRR